MSRKLDNLDRKLAVHTHSLEKASQDLKWEMAQAGLSAAGTVDPTPITDSINAGTSFTRGDAAGGLTDIASGWMPYLGDSLKGLKAGKVADKIAGLKRSIESLTLFTDKYKDPYARGKEAAKRVRESRQQNACRLPSGESKWKTQLPRSGKFDRERGDSTWTSEDGKYSIEYKEGYPDFKTATTPDEQQPTVIKEVEISQMGKSSDFTAANKAAGYTEKPDGYTWHHKEDGITMQLVREDVHSRSLSNCGGAAQTDGNSVLNDQQS